MFIKMQLAGFIRDVRNEQIQHYEQFGWERIKEEPQEVINPEPLIEPKAVDSGAILVKAPKKKKSEKTAETATEAAEEDQGNDISKGEK